MKAGLLTIALCMSMPSMAAGHLCDSVESVARTVMQQRQEGASMGKMMESTTKIQDPMTAAMAREIVETAYEKPQFRTDQHKKRAIDGHANEWASVCWRRNK